MAQTEPSAERANRASALDAIVTTLLEPIAGEWPAGQDLRSGSDFQQISEARREEAARMPRNIWQRETKTVDWPHVEQMCREALTQKAKDIALAAWLIESWTQQYGFAGLAPGFRLLNGLCQRYWDTIFPTIAQDDLSARAIPIEWLDGRLPVIVRQHPIAGADGSVRYNWSDYLTAQRLETVRQQNPEAAHRAEMAGAITLTMFRAAQDRTDKVELAAMAIDLNASLDVLALLETTLDERFAGKVPSLARIRDLIGEIADFTRAGPRS